MNALLSITIAYCSGAAIYIFLQNFYAAVFMHLMFIILPICLLLIYTTLNNNSGTRLLLAVIITFFFCSGFICSEVDYKDKNAKSNILKSLTNTEIKAGVSVENTISYKEKRQVIDIRIIDIEEKKSKIAMPENYRALLICSSKKKYLPGDILTVRGTVIKIRSLKNPRIKPYEDYMGDRGYFYQISAPTEPVVEQKKSRFSLKHFACNLKYSIIEKISGQHNPQNSSLISGIVFGERIGLTKETNELFTQTGTVHLLAASGMNISIITCSIMFILRRLKVSNIICLIISCPLIICYIYMANSSACVIRAGIMACVSLIAGASDRNYDLLNSLFLTLLIMATADTSIIRDIGFQLSFMAVLGIWVYSKFIHPSIKNFHPAIKYTAGAILLSISIETLTTPITAYYFCQWTPWSPIANLIVVPLSTVILYGGIAESIATYLPGAGQYIAGINDLCCTMTLYAQKWLRSLPCSFIPVCSPDLLQIYLYYTAIGVLLHKKNKHKYAALILPILMMFFCLHTAEKQNTDYMTLTFLDVGNGDSCLIRTAHGKNILIDCGSSGKKTGQDIGEKVIAPFLLKSRIKKLDIVIISHNDDDHCGGLKSLQKKINTGKIITGNRLFIPQTINIEKNLSMDFLWPEGEYKKNNDNSIVVKINYFNTSVFFCGDISTDVENKISQTYENIESDIIKVPHHGSITSSGENFINRVNPQIAVISAGYKNRSGHPHRKILDRYKNAGCSIFRTDLDGAIEIKIMKDGKKHVKAARGK